MFRMYVANENFGKCDFDMNKGSFDISPLPVQNVSNINEITWPIAKKLLWKIHLGVTQFSCIRSATESRDNDQNKFCIFASSKKWFSSFESFEAFCRISDANIRQI